MVEMGVFQAGREFTGALLSNSAKGRPEARKIVGGGWEWLGGRRNKLSYELSLNLLAFVDRTVNLPRCFSDTFLYKLMIPQPVVASCILIVSSADTSFTSM